jgi:Uma2 family endonuclease
MPTSLPPLSRKHFSRAEYHWLNENGLFQEELHYELFNGDIIEQMPQKQPHTVLVMQLLFALAEIFGQDFLWCQMPVVLSDETEPEPDVAVTTQSQRSYLTGDSPHAADIRLIIEVSVTTLEFDLGAKAVRYAQASIPEYWVLDVAGRALIVHRGPNSEGYTSITRLAETETVSPLSAPQASLNVINFLP